MGIASFWMGVGCLYPTALHACTSTGSNPCSPQSIAVSGCGQCLETPKDNEKEKGSGARLSTYKALECDTVVLLDLNGGILACHFCHFDQVTPHHYKQRQYSKSQKRGSSSYRTTKQATLQSPISWIIRSAPRQLDGAGLIVSLCGCWVSLHPNTCAGCRRCALL